jgi:hypothetical protein
MTYKTRLKRLGKTDKWLHNQNGGAEKRKVPTKIRNKLEVLKRVEVKNSFG